MHELSIARNIVEVVSDRIGMHPGCRVASVTLIVGEVSGVDTELLEYAFPVAAEGTPLAEAVLNIGKKPVSTRELL